MNRKSSLCFMAVAISCLLSTTNVQASIMLNGRELKDNAQTKVVGGTTLVPIRTISEELGAKVHYESATKKVYITKDDKSIVLTVNSKEAIVDNESITLPEKVINLNGTTLVPLRFIAETLECTITYDPTVYFDGKNIESTAEIKKEHYVDITNDGVEDRIVIRGNRDDWDTNDIITFYDGKSGEVLTSTNEYSMDLFIQEDSFFDITGDGVKDFILYQWAGGSAGGFYQALIYKDGTYVAVPSQDIDTEFSINDYFQCEYRDTVSGKYCIKEFTPAQREKLIAGNLYTREGVLLEDGYWGRSGGATFQDVDGDGIFEYMETCYIKNFGHDINIYPTSIWKYEDGMMKLSGLDIKIE